VILIVSQNSIATGKQYARDNGISTVLIEADCPDDVMYLADDEYVIAPDDFTVTQVAKPGQAVWLLLDDDDEEVNK
jgi:hypothetical protein